jgi:hypothetical protein
MKTTLFPHLIGVTYDPPICYASFSSSDYRDKEEVQKGENHV